MYTLLQKKCKMDSLVFPGAEGQGPVSPISRQTSDAKQTIPQTDKQTGATKHIISLASWLIIDIAYRVGSHNIMFNPLPETNVLSVCH